MSSPYPDGPQASDILHFAAEAVSGPRAQTHGDATRSFTMIANLWGMYLEGAHGERVTVTALDVAWMMTLLKIARSVQGKMIEDHAVDAAGYAGIAGEIGLGHTET